MKDSLTGCDFPSPPLNSKLWDIEDMLESEMDLYFSAWLDNTKPLTAAPLTLSEEYNIFSKGKLVFIRPYRLLNSLFICSWIEREHIQNLWEDFLWKTIARFVLFCSLLIW